MQSLKYQPEILFEDNHLIAINKPAGLLVQGDETGDIPLTELMKLFIKERDHKPGNVFMGLIHRLDRPVSGLVLLAKTSKALERMNRKFSTREVQKTYLAMVEGIPSKPSGLLRHFLVKNEKNNYVKAFNQPVPEGKEAVLEYHVLETLHGKSLLEVNPHTGRPHQIRVQLASMQTPIKGDTKYGSPNSNPDFSINLHAWKLRFEHPVNEAQLIIEAPCSFWRQRL